MDKSLIVVEQAVVNEEWFDQLIDDCKSIITEMKFWERWTVIEGYWHLGERITTDENYQKAAKGNLCSLTRVSKNLNTSERSLYYAIEFYNKYPDLSLLPRGKAISWHYIRNKLLSAPQEDGELPPISGEWYQLYCGDFKQICQDLEPKSVDAIITDPPYDLESVSLYSDLGQMASKLLKDGGSLLVMSGNMYLPDLLNSLSKYLNYQWQIAFVMGKGTSRVRQRKVCQMWKPILWFVKGEYGGKWIVDLFKSKKPEKKLGKWQQPESISAWLINRFSKPNGYVLDPMMGTGTTGVQAIELHRHFIGIDISEENVNIARRRLNGSQA